MQRLEVSGAVRPLLWSLGVKGLTATPRIFHIHHGRTAADISVGCRSSSM